MDAIFEIFEPSKKGKKANPCYTGSLETCTSIISEIISETNKIYVVKITISEKREEEN